MTGPMNRRKRRASGLSLIALGAAGLLWGTTVSTTSALWSDSAAVQSSTFTLGTVGIDLQGEGSGPLLFDISDFAPGDTTSSELRISNTGSLPIDYTIAAAVVGELDGYVDVTVLPASTGQLDPGAQARPVLQITWDKSNGTPSAPQGSRVFSSQIEITVDAVNRVR